MKANILFGPFVGDLRWELYRFAPYLIYLKNKYPSFVKFIVYTRSESFDLYGRYADVLIPLDLENDLEEYRNGFSTDIIDQYKYDKLKLSFIKKYKSNKSKIIETFCPDIENQRYKLKWQYPRQSMLYKFFPRSKNLWNIKKLIPDKENIIVDLCNNNVHSTLDLLKTRYINTNIILVNNKNYIDDHDFIDLDKFEYDNYVSKIGYLLNLFKNCKLFVGNLDSKYTLLAFCMKQNIILLNEKRPNVDIKPLNPYRIKFRKTNTISDIGEKYENSF